MGSWALRLTAIPQKPLALGRLPHQPWLQNVRAETFNGPGRQGQLSSYDLAVERVWMPRLRAIEREMEGTHLFGSTRINSDGQVERFARYLFRANGGRPNFMHLTVGQFMWHVASTIRTADIVRSHAGRPTQNYAFEIELMTSDQMHLDSYGGVVPLGLQNLPPCRVVFPRHEIAERESFNVLLTTVDYDLWSAAGNHVDWNLEVNWPPAR